MIVLSIGHSIGRQGAKHAGISEHTISCMMAEYINHPNITIINDGLIETVKNINKVHDVTLAAELHWNAGGSASTKGCETLYCPGSKAGKAAATRFQQQYLEGVDTRDRGVKEGWYKMRVGGAVDYFLSGTKCPAIILEPEFIHQIVVTPTHNYQHIAQVLVQSLLAANKGI